MFRSLWGIEVEAKDELDQFGRLPSQLAREAIQSLSRPVLQWDEELEFVFHRGTIDPHRIPVKPVFVPAESARRRFSS